MKKARKGCVYLLCIHLLAFAGGCARATLSPLSPVHVGQDITQTSPKGEIPPVSEQEQEEQEIPQQPQEEEPTPPQEETIIVRFLFHDGTFITKSFKKGEVVEERDLPAFEKETGFVYQWDLDGVALTKNVDYTQTRYKTLATAEELLAIQPNEKYFLQEDITISEYESIPVFAGVIEGNGKTITLQNASKPLFISFYGSLQNVVVQATFSGEETPLGTYTAQGCALIKEIDHGAYFKNCNFQVEYTASATEQNPSAGLAITLLNARFENCTLQTVASQTAHVYALCVQKSSCVDLTGLTVQQNGLKCCKFFE